MAQPVNGGKPTPNLAIKSFLRSHLLLPTAILLLTTVGFVLFTFQRRSIALSAAAAANLKVVETEMALLTAEDDAETGQRGFLLTGQEEYLDPYYKGTKNSVN